MPSKVAPSVAFACLLFLAGCSDPKPLAVTERGTVPSPSGKKEARIATFDLNPGARVQNVYIVPKGFVGDLSGSTSAARIAGSVQDCRDEDFSVRWISDDQLVLVFRQDRPSWVNFVPYVDGVAIEIENQSKSPNQISEPTAAGGRGSP